MGKVLFKDIRPYNPKTGNKALDKEFKDEINNTAKQYKIIGDFASGQSYYKYFALSTAIMCLKENTLALVEPSRWNDAYESLYYEADYSKVSTDYKTHPKVYATCLTNKKYDEPAWRIYSGDDNICVQFEINRPLFRYYLLKSISNKDTIYEGAIQYASKSTIDCIWKKKIKNSKTGIDKDNQLYIKYIARPGSAFSIDNYLNLLLLKRDDFFHEQETRIIIVKKDDLENEETKAKETQSEITDATKRETIVNRGGLIVLKNINWLDCIKRITINANEKDYHYTLLEKTINDKIDADIKDVKQRDDYKQRLKPISYLVYGTKPPVLTIDG